jgi:hypothetical protein
MCAVKTGKAQREQMFSALPLRADIAQCSRHVRFVPADAPSTELAEQIPGLRYVAHLA